MEKTQRDDTNGVLPTGSGGEPPQPPAPETPDLPTPGQGGGAGLFGKGFKMPTSMSGLMGMLPFGALIMGIGTILGQQAKYESAQYGAENEFQRRNNRGNHWLLNMLTFGISGAEAEKKEVGRNAATQNDRALGDYAALHRMSYRQALGSQFVDSFGDNVDYVTGGNTSYHDYKMATDWSYRQKQEQKKVNPPQPGTIDLDGLVAFPTSQHEAEAWKDWEYSQKKQQLRNADKAGLVTDRDELPTWASRTLGLNMTKLNINYAKFLFRFWKKQLHFRMSVGFHGHIVGNSTFANSDNPLGWYSTLFQFCGNKTCSRYTQRIIDT